MQKEEGDYMAVKKEKARECKYLNSSLGSVCSPCIQKESELLQGCSFGKSSKYLRLFCCSGELLPSLEVLK